MQISTQKKGVHPNCDHSGLLETLVARSRATVYAHPLTAQLMRRDAAVRAEWSAFYDKVYRGMDMSTAPVDKQKQAMENEFHYMGDGRVDVELREGMRIPGAEDWEVIETPGHSQDHISLLRQDEGTILLGDHLIKHIATVVGLEPPLAPERPRPNLLRLHRESMRKLRERDWQIGLAGHGKIITAPHDLLAKRLAASEKRSAWNRSFASPSTRRTSTWKTSVLLKKSNRSSPKNRRSPPKDHSINSLGPAGS